ncbi:hypothetical protein QBC35DRAFT_477652 [Podospora australis]|uniref:Uncharacterized protein n=1 Tax=Podospora australis TaxID=1536484 RepID=A0AAN6WKW6_9PEZI|nr:hypothetical protein QBC35DRAFT_477652 [Podospora australis]
MAHRDENLEANRAEGGQILPGFFFNVPISGGGLVSSTTSLPLPKQHHARMPCPAVLASSLSAARGPFRFTNAVVSWKILCRSSTECDITGLFHCNAEFEVHLPELTTAEQSFTSLSAADELRRCVTVPLILLCNGLREPAWHHQVANLYEQYEVENSRLPLRMSPSRGQVERNQGGGRPSVFPPCKEKKEKANQPKHGLTQLIQQYISFIYKTRAVSIA